VARSKVLALVNRDASPLEDAGACAIRSLDALRPHSTSAQAPKTELHCVFGTYAVFDGEAVRVAEKHAVTGLPDDGMQLIEL
jgi:hypothetical protein